MLYIYNITICVLHGDRGVFLKRLDNRQPDPKIAA